MSILGSDFPTRSVGAAAAKAALAKAIAHLNLSYVNFPLNFDILILMHTLSESACDGFVWW